MARKNTAKMFEASMRVVSIQSWCVEADNEQEAREMIERLHASVEVDETGGETIDWDIRSIKAV